MGSVCMTAVCVGGVLALCKALLILPLKHGEHE